VLPFRARRLDPMQKELLHGTLEVMILKTLSWGPMHGYGIGKWIEQLSDGTLRIEEGSLYPALYRLERKEWIDAEWGQSENNRRAKYYRLTEQGRRELRAGESLWTDFAAAVGRVLSARRQPA
jgi:PadR family transcriptional regulator, regulatory protein PadR